MKNQLTFAKTTNLGGRNINEDSIGIVEQERKIGFVLCDGLGGHGLGDVASQMVVDVFTNEIRQSDKCHDIITRTFENSQKRILEEQRIKDASSKIKTTAVIAVVDEHRAYIGHIGDSRLYIFRNNEIKKRTIDHSIPQMLALSKEIKDEDIRNHPDRNMLLRVIGTEWQEPQYEMMKPIPLRKIQAMLLCSDGFWELIDEEAMCQCLKDANSVDEWLETMIKVVEINGSGRDMDNFSAIAIWNERK